MTKAVAFDEHAAMRKWQELAPLLDTMMKRVGTEGEFPVATGSSLAGDDKASNPYQLSHAVRCCLMAGTDHLHAAKVLIVDQQTLHVAAPSSLARGALETIGTAYWMLQPQQRKERITRTLRWHAQNMKDADKALAQRDLPGYKPLDAKLAKLDALAISRSLDPTTVRKGYTSTMAIECADQNEQDLPLGLVLPWRLCSGFAHGRP